MPTEDRPILLVRLRRGVVGETKRIVHVVPIPDPDVMPEELTAYCGARFTPGAIELLSEPTGIPCVSCLALAPVPSAPALPPKSDRNT